jgi:hypothetical protein
MSLLLLLRPSAGGADQTVTHSAGVLALVGGTHSLTYSGSVSHTIGSLALVGGTHTVAYGGTVTAEPGVLNLVGGTHTVDNGEPAEIFERTKTGVGI